MVLHTFRSVIDVVHSSDFVQDSPQPTNRQLSRTETNMITIPPDGQTPSKPTVLGEPNGAPPIQVYATGMFKSLRKGETRWVTGAAIDDALASGVLAEINVDPLDTPIQVVEPKAITPVVPPAVPTATNAEVALADMSKSQLVKLAQKLGLEGRSAMDKSELYEHLRHHPEVAQHLH
jgi:hypothetical protein